MTTGQKVAKFMACVLINKVEFLVSSDKPFKPSAPLESLRDMWQLTEMGYTKLDHATAVGLLTGKSEVYKVYY